MKCQGKATQPICIDTWKKCKKWDERQISHLPHHQPTLMITYIQGIHCSILFKVSYIPMCKKCSLRFRNNHVNHTSTYSVLFFRAGVIFLRKSTHVLVSHGYLQCATNVLNSALKPQQYLTNLLHYTYILSDDLVLYASF